MQHHVPCTSLRGTSPHRSQSNRVIACSRQFHDIYANLLVSIQPADRTPPIQSDKYQCHIDTVIFSWWWALGCPKHVQKWNKYNKQNCAPSWTYLQDYTGRHGQQKLIFMPTTAVVGINIVTPTYNWWFKRTALTLTPWLGSFIFPTFLRLNM